ncbi:C13 family peptidase [Rhodanobacter sp. DHG33]|uniref:C13 family peptidase n=1 Tax=Rhodanobacter sp. DHG33 TaxID=2775921 RepID=UPI001784E267|nr:C13 family peptidase [Rhodanobacter sp. DHG33]MBD8900238.1 caspase family protein [Rhodanobacter sp. DHG33]
MRTALTALFAFAAGILLMLWLPGHASSPSTTTTTMIATTSSVASASSAADDGDDEGDANNWPQQGPTPEQVQYAQPKMLQDELAKLGPRVPGKPNLYLVTFAGDGSQDVFRNEAEYAAKLFRERFGASTHTLVLENNPASLSTYPIAGWNNLETALDGLSKVMQPDDILMLYVTTHGSDDHELLVDMDPLPLDQIGAQDLADILKEHAFKWKVVVVNACYSGGFIPPLATKGTLVLTSARTDRSSFGCGTESDLTYFGHAFLVDALNRTDNFADAFGQAKTEIAQWEQRDKLTPSEPQSYVGDGIEGQLDAWRKGIVPGPSVRFMAAPPAPASTAATP